MSAWHHMQYCGTGYIFHKRPHFLGEWVSKLFMGKEIKRASVKLADLLNPVPIPQKTTFSRAVPGTYCNFMQVLGVGRVRKLLYGKEIAVFRFWDDV